jgi:hypothetical protein
VRRRRMTGVVGVIRVKKKKKKKMIVQLLCNLLVIH